MRLSQWESSIKSRVSLKDTIVQEVLNFYLHLFPTKKVQAQAVISVPLSFLKDDL